MRNIVIYQDGTEGYRVMIDNATCQQVYETKEDALIGATKAIGENCEHG